MKIERIEVVVYTPELRKDERGWFMESFKESDDPSLPQFVQDNHSFSHKHVLRGLHYQFDPPMSKLMRVTHVAALLVAVNLKTGASHQIVCSAENRKQVYAPAHYARGFLVLEEGTEVQYKCSALYNPEGEGAIRWNDPDLRIHWLISNPIVSAKDKHAPRWKDVPCQF